MCALCISTKFHQHLLSFITLTLILLELESSGAAFAFDTYFDILISIPSGLFGAIGGRVAVGPNAERTGLAAKCKRRGFCPATSSGVYYIERCLNFLDPTLDDRWNSDDPSIAQLFAYGSSRAIGGCRACPIGCRCPGGERCRAVKGFYVPHEKLPDSSDASPAVCHPDPVVSGRRCPAFDISLERTRCEPGRDGPLCGECARGYYARDTAGGECTVCPNSKSIVNSVLAISATFFGIASVAFVVVAVVQVRSLVPPTSFYECS